MREPATILVVLPNWVGDGAMAAPALRALRTARGDARLILAGTERSAPLYGRWPCDAVIPVRAGSARATLAFARRLRGLGIDAALIMSPSFRAALIPWLAGIRRRVGWGTDGRRLLLTDALPAPSRDVHLARSYLALAARLGADPSTTEDPTLPLGSDEKGVAMDRLRGMGIAPARCIALLPGATYGETKRWPLPSWVAFGRALRARGWSLLVMGGEGERAASEKLRGEIGVGAVASLAGDLTLRGSMSVLSLLAGAVSNDSGGMHLAGAAGTPVIGIFGSTNPAWTGPLGARSRTVSLGLRCSPCYGRTCPTQIECLRDLSPERVLSEFEILMEGEGGGRG